MWLGCVCAPAHRPHSAAARMLRCLDALVAARLGDARCVIAADLRAVPLRARLRNGVARLLSPYLRATQTSLSSACTYSSHSSGSVSPWTRSLDRTNAAALTSFPLRMPFSTPRAMATLPCWGTVKARRSKVRLLRGLRASRKFC